jgi:hypothetical protein
MSDMGERIGERIVLALFILFCITIFFVAFFKAPEWVLWTVEGIGVAVAVIVYTIRTSAD